MICTKAKTKQMIRNRDNILMQLSAIPKSARQQTHNFEFNFETAKLLPEGLQNQLR